MTRKAVNSLDAILQTIELHKKYLAENSSSHAENSLLIDGLTNPQDTYEVIERLKNSPEIRKIDIGNDFKKSLLDAYLECQKGAFTMVFDSNDEKSRARKFKAKLKDIEEFNKYIGQGRKIDFETEKRLYSEQRKVEERARRANIIGSIKEFTMPNGEDLRFEGFLTPKNLFEVIKEVNKAFSDDSSLEFIEIDRDFAKSLKYIIRSLEKKIQDPANKEDAEEVERDLDVVLKFSKKLNYHKKISDNIGKGAKSIFIGRTDINFDRNDEVREVVSLIRSCITSERLKDIVIDKSFLAVIEKLKILKKDDQSVLNDINLFQRRNCNIFVIDQDKASKYSDFEMLKEAKEDSLTGPRKFYHENLGKGRKGGELDRDSAAKSDKTLYSLKKSPTVSIKMDSDKVLIDSLRGLNQATKHDTVLITSRMLSRIEDLKSSNRLDEESSRVIRNFIDCNRRAFLITNEEDVELRDQVGEYRDPYENFKVNIGVGHKKAEFGNIVSRIRSSKGEIILNSCHEGDNFSFNKAELVSIFSILRENEEITKTYATKEFYENCENSLRIRDGEPLDQFLDRHNVELLENDIQRDIKAVDCPIITNLPSRVADIVYGVQKKPSSRVHYNRIQGENRREPEHESACGDDAEKACGEIAEGLTEMGMELGKAAVVVAAVPLAIAAGAAAIPLLPCIICCGANDMGCS